MKKIKIFPSPHTEVIIHVSDQMVKDMKSCQSKPWDSDEAPKCDSCSWNDVELFDTGMCGVDEVVDKVLERKKE